MIGRQAETIRRIRALQPSIRTAFLVGKARLDRERVPARESVRWARELGATQLGIDHRALTPDVVEAARAAGIEVGAWTVNEERDLQSVIRVGVNVVTSDRPDLALRLLGR
jgi:glycerophosphoryl diester phosphodiesterase